MTISLSLVINRLSGTEINKKILFLKSLLKNENVFSYSFMPIAKVIPHVPWLSIYLLCEPHL